MSNERQVTIYTASDSTTASLLVSLLEEHDIRALVLNETVQSGAVEFFGTPVAPKVVVAADDAEEARAIAVEFDRQLIAGVHRVAPDESVDQTSTIPAWPVCASCRQPRHTTCEICGTSGSDFPLADMPALVYDEDHEEEDIDQIVEVDAGLLVICPTCDEPFEPEFLRRCQWCNYDFGDGREIDVLGDASDVTAPVDVANHRVVALAAGLLAVLVALAIYFASITSG